MNEQKPNIPPPPHDLRKLPPKSNESQIQEANSVKTESVGAEELFDTAQNDVSSTKKEPATNKGKTDFKTVLCWIGVGVCAAAIAVLVYLFIAL